MQESSYSKACGDDAGGQLFTAAPDILARLCIVTCCPSSSMRRYVRSHCLTCLDHLASVSKNSSQTIMSDEKRGLSLRKKKVTRPKISAPKDFVKGTSPNPSDAPFPGTLDVRPDMPALERTETSQSSLRGRPSMNADRTADLIKRRYSTRFADTGPAGPMPAMPAIPPQFQQQTSVSPTRGRRSPERPGQKGIRVDARALRDPHLQPEQCTYGERELMYRAKIRRQMLRVYWQTQTRQTSQTTRWNYRS